MWDFASEINLGIGALLMLTVGMFKVNSLICRNLLFVVLAGSLGLLFFAQPYSDSLFVQNDFRILSKCLVLAFSIVGVFLTPSKWFKEFEEIPIILAIGILGALVSLSSANFISLYLGLEMQALAFCVLIPLGSGFAFSREAALKYFSLSALSTSFYLYGVTLIYSATDSISLGFLSGLSGWLSSAQPLAIAGFAMVLLSLFFKVSAAPMHFWSPDVYQGAPTYITLWLACPMKIASIIIFSTFMLENNNAIFIVLAACLSLFLGSFMALRQIYLKRLLAYSSISHIGYIMLIFITDHSYGLLIVYLAVYGIGTAGILGITMLLSLDEKPVESIKNLSGLGVSHPWLAFGMSCFLLSLAGIPFLAGFWTKFWLFIGLIQSSLNIYIMSLALGAIAVNTVISVFYYLSIIRTMYFESKESFLKINYGFFQKLFVGLLLGLVLGFVLLQPWMKQIIEGLNAVN